MVQRSDYLLEIGTEELPSGFLATSARELQDKLQEAFHKHRLAHGTIEVLQTPRRLAVIVRELAASQESAEELLKGPPASIALEASGNPTPAGLGFAKKMGVSFDQLQQQDIDGTRYVVYHKFSEGRPVADILPDILPDVVLSLSGSHFMAWDKSDIRFSRPIRWIVSLYGETPLPLTIGMTPSGTVSMGHRFLSDSPEVPVTSVATYQTQLKTRGHVVVDQCERRAMIMQGLEQKALELNGTVPPNNDLLDTVTMLVEAPALIAGSFSEHFLTLPKEVITTVMASHQKYFPVEDANQKLRPYFITISNNTNSQAEATIRHGNEKVLRARLEDASFFFQEDTKQPLQHYVALLEGITFQKGLGSLLDKTRRLEVLSSIVGQAMGFDSSQVKDVLRAAQLCKADLATNMVRELTELQGIMGQRYAEMSEEKPEVALAISQHYRPRFMGDPVASLPLGIALSLADKLDTLMAVFSQKDARYPTGSKDPMGLRRMALGVIVTVLDNQLTLDLDLLLREAYLNLGEKAVEPEQATCERTQQFLLQRLKGYFLEQNYSYDAIDAVLEAGVSPLKNLLDTSQRLQLIKELQKDPMAFKTIYEPANRTARILGGAYRTDVTPSQIDPALFESEAEKALFESLGGSSLEHLSSEALLTLFFQWAPRVEAFFDNVMVNAENPKVKENRYRLLSLCNRVYLRFADFTKLVV